MQNQTHVGFNLFFDAAHCTLLKAMQEYGIYTLGKDGKIWSPPGVIKRKSDEAAIAPAKHVVNGTAVQVWQTARRVIRLDPIHPPSP